MPLLKNIPCALYSQQAKPNNKLSEKTPCFCFCRKQSDDARKIFPFIYNDLPFLDSTHTILICNFSLSVICSCDFHIVNPFYSFGSKC